MADDIHSYFFQLRPTLSWTKKTGPGGGEPNKYKREHEQRGKEDKPKKRCNNFYDTFRHGRVVKEYKKSRIHTDN
jgi:hypothetical protein